MLISRTVLRASVAALAAASLALTGCSNSEEDSTAATTEAASSAAATAEQSASAGSSQADDADEGAVSFEDGVVRAMEEGSDMTAIFGTLHNTTDKDISVVGFTSSIEAKQYQIHEVVDGVMQEKDGGFNIPAGEAVKLEPGSYHFMLMGVAEPIMAGEHVTMTLELGDGSTVELGDIPVRSIGAGDENYGDMADMEHGDHMDHKH
ncbi:copper chaperone PCu(A)C [Corynebacterium minutissimum]|uniref:Copper chaperone PCu(A)C n=1 Tax=Corynebacterium minutissimum TaxID=38301 RepID=A0A2X4RCS6_9CORY|nr:copper chaperone PCu(A)C [Corynebacterium minutissimum]KHO28517.1 hypothetical protein NX84_11945 [Corynebacterium minutissimum]QPS59058.1 copper chaperone PCu(A)C [Corynebacterium minutissimum]QQA80152.1 copper chaperone PCu(A)C [Corynebacterium minutissimum]SQH99779.1 putative secreted protein [Corynebacterium minutissimum]VEG06154.1 putative secreted protein [Corynebacterium minutissimum]